MRQYVGLKKSKGYLKKDVTYWQKLHSAQSLGCQLYLGLVCKLLLHRTEHSNFVGNWFFLHKKYGSVIFCIIHPSILPREFRQSTTSILLIPWGNTCSCFQKTNKHHTFSFDSVSKLSIVIEVWPTGGIMVANDVSSYVLHWYVFACERVSFAHI